MHRFYRFLILLFLLSACSFPTAGTPTPTPFETGPDFEPPTDTPIPATEIIPTEIPATPTETPLPTETPAPSAGGRSAGDPYFPEIGNTGYDVQHYTLKLDIAPFGGSLAGDVTIEALATLHNMNEFSLDFVGFNITSVTVNDVETPYSREGRKLIIQPAQPLLSEEIFTVRVQYNGQPFQESSPYMPFLHHVGIQFLGNNVYVLNQPDGSRYWYPANDHPTDKATYTMELTAPDGLLAIGNGSFVESRPGATAGTTTHVWHQPAPMSTYLAAFAIGDYVKLESTSPNGVPIIHYVHADKLQEFNDATRNTGAAIDWMSEMFGDYPFTEFGFATTRVIQFSVESQSTVMLSENMLNEETVIHEIAHMWFGNWVGIESWAETWFTEGFAVYISMMWQYPDYLNSLADNLEAEVAREGSSDPLGNLSPQLLLGFDSYQRGALMMHRLRQTVGDEAFFNGLRTFFETYGGGSASGEDFQQVMEDASGMDLGSFFVEWLE